MYFKGIMQESKWSSRLLHWSKEYLKQEGKRMNYREKQVNFLSVFLLYACVILFFGIL